MAPPSMTCNAPGQGRADADLDSVAAVLATYAAQTESNGRLAPRSVEALQGTEVFAMGLAHSEGGAPATVVLETLALLGAACPASSWVVGTTATSKRFATAAFGSSSAATIVGPAAPSCGSGKPQGVLRRVDGELRLDGRWRWISGCELAEFAVLGAAGPDGDAAAGMSVVVVPVAELGLVRDWDVAGMRGTGSHTLVADDVLVAEDRRASVRFDPRFPAFSAVTVLGPVLGAVAGARQLTAELFDSNRRPMGSPHEHLRDSPAARQLLFRATHSFDEAVMIARDACAQIDAGGASTPETSLRVLSRLARASRIACDALNPMLDLQGASGFRDESPIQRFWRDATVGARHPLLSGYVLDEQVADQL